MVFLLLMSDDVYWGQFNHDGFEQLPEGTLTLSLGSAPGMLRSLLAGAGAAKSSLACVHVVGGGTPSHGHAIRKFGLSCAPVSLVLRTSVFRDDVSFTFVWHKKPADRSAVWFLMSEEYRRNFRAGVPRWRWHLGSCSLNPANMQEKVNIDISRFLPDRNKWKADGEGLLRTRLPGLFTVTLEYLR